MNYKPLLYALLIGSTAVSCIRKEAPNAEAEGLHRCRCIVR